MDYASCRLEASKGWTIKADGCHGWRRVVASPAPMAIQEAQAVATLLQHNFITICCGGTLGAFLCMHVFRYGLLLYTSTGGGIPVAQDPATGAWHGVEAVIDKDAASALLASTLRASTLLLLTDADAVYDPDAWSQGKRIKLSSPIAASELATMTFAAGSMGPKVAAAVDFVNRNAGAVAGIGALQDAAAIMAGHAGTLIVSG